MAKKAAGTVSPKAETIHRSAVSGRYVKAEYRDLPRTAVVEGSGRIITGRNLKTGDLFRGGKTK